VCGGVAAVGATILIKDDRLFMNFMSKHPVHLPTAGWLAAVTAIARFTSIVLGGLACHAAKQPS
jgi:hypothetical protein